MVKKIVISFLVVITLFSFYSLNQQIKRNTKIQAMSQTEKQQYEQAFVNTYLNEIILASDEFYKEYFKVSPVLNYYSVNLKELSQKSRSYYLTFETNPYLGAHMSVGKDEITFLADYTGTVTMTDFKHLYSYEMPEWLQGHVIKRIPGEYKE